MSIKTAAADLSVPNIRSKRKSALQLIWRDKCLYLIMLPVLVHLFVFSYLPMYGIIISFQDFMIGDSMFSFKDVDWVGFYNFVKFFKSIYFFRVVGNTFINGVMLLVFGFWVPVVFALLLNEVKNKVYKRTVQTLSYLPYFISTVIVAGIVISFLSAQDGIINTLIENLGFQRIKFLNEPQYFRLIYVVTGIWQTFGWSAVVYIAAISSIDQTLYEAATIDGAGRWQQVIHVTLPGISSAIVIMLILAVGNLMSDNTEKIILLYNPAIYETADVIGSYTYRVGVRECNYSYATAVGTFTAVINFILLDIANRISKKVSDYGLW